MKANVVRGAHQLALEELPDPKIEQDEVLVAVRRSSICNATDVHIWEGTFPPDVCPPYPHVLGHECAGEIVEVGSKVDGYQVGDRIGWWCKMTGAHGELNAIKPGSLAVAKLSPHLSWEEGALLEIVGGTMRLFYDSRMRPADRVMVLGMGATGLVLIQEAKLLGAACTLGVDLLRFRLDMATKVGADLAYNLTGVTFEQALADLRGMVEEVDVVIDAMGNHLWEGGNSIELALWLLRPGGSYEVFGHPTRNTPVNTRVVSGRGIVMKGFSTPMRKTRDLIHLGERWVAEGKLLLEPIVTHHVPLDRLVEGLVLCRDHPDRTLKVVVDVS